jgi:tetratricopeptide (TPR) repeat protein
MYLRTPKRYTAKGSRRSLLNLRWLWLYILAPIILIPAVLVYNFRAELTPTIDNAIQNVQNQINVPPPTATLPVQDLEEGFAKAVQSGRISTALKALQDLASSKPNATAYHSLLAQWMILRAYGTDNTPELLSAAARAGRSAINANPEDASGWVSHALVLDWSGKPQEALPYALRARDLSEKDPFVLAVLGEIYHDLGKDDEAMTYVEEAITLAKAADPLNRTALTHAYYVQAIILATTSPYGSEADDAYKLALQAAGADDPLIPTGYITFFLGVDYMNADKTDLAIDLLGKAIERDQEDPLLPYLLGRVYYKNGDDVKAQKYFETCHDLDGTQPKCLRWLGVMYMRKSNWTQAAKTYQQLVDQGSTVAADYLGAAQAYSNQNQCATAVPILQKGAALTESGAERASFEDALRACGFNGGISVPPPTVDSALATDAAPSDGSTPASATAIPTQTPSVALPPK